MNTEELTDSASNAEQVIRKLLISFAFERVFLNFDHPKVYNKTWRQLLKAITRSPRATFATSAWNNSGKTKKPSRHTQNLADKFHQTMKTNKRKKSMKPRAK